MNYALSSSLRDISIRASFIQTYGGHAVMDKYQSKGNGGGRKRKKEFVFQDVHIKNKHSSNQKLIVEMKRKLIRD